MHLDKSKLSVLLLLLAIAALAVSRRHAPFKKEWFRHLSGWQKIFGVIAIIAALLIVFNPDFLALGLLGDTTFFDLFIFALSVQMLTYVQSAWGWLRASFVKSMRWFGIPSPGFRYVLAVWMLAAGTAMTIIQKIARRLFL